MPIILRLSGAALTLLLGMGVSASADGAPDNKIWCTDSYKPDRGTLTLTEKGFDLLAGSVVEHLTTDGTSTPWGAGVYDSDKGGEAVVLLPATVIFGHDEELKKQVFILRDRVYWPCGSDKDQE